MVFLIDLIQSLIFLVRGAVDALLGRRRKRYAVSVGIMAPLDLVWETANARDITFEGPPRYELTSTLKPGTTDVYEVTIKVADREAVMTFREIESKPREGLLIEMLREGSDPVARFGDDHFVACTVAERQGGTLLTIVHELTHTRFLGRIFVPLGARQNARRLQRHCEGLAGSSTDPRWSKLGSAVMTGLLTYASFAYLFDWQFAAVLLALLVVHEAGHALAMLSVGQPVAGIYFIPFFGGVAVSAAPHRSESERGFVALMGPGFSLLTTSGFVLGAYMTGDPLLHQLAFVSAILNGINLAPVLPLDGGQVIDAVMSRSDPEMVAIVNMLALIAGVGIAVYFEWHMLVALLMLTALSLFRSGNRPRKATPISVSGRNWLAAGYMATLAYYIAVVSHLMA